MSVKSYSSSESSESLSSLCSSSSSPLLIKNLLCEDDNNSCTINFVRDESINTSDPFKYAASIEPNLDKFNTIPFIHLPQPCTLYPPTLDIGSPKDLDDFLFSRDIKNISLCNQTSNKPLKSKQTKYLIHHMDRISCKKSYERNNHNTNTFSFKYDHPVYDVNNRIKRKRATVTQTQTLQRIFEKTAFPSTTLREHLARSLDMSPRAVQIWFQNRRQAARRVCSSI